MMREFYCIIRICVTQYNIKLLDIDACLNKSPQDMSFTFIIDISELNQPAHCQDADVSACFPIYVIVLILVPYD